ncbi:hypothetical protein BIT28_03315 [Photobacterium proteolyticum]|uniref:Uncharacterized protein n=1 Tax=Photobacterium proteolyticum TaxID=1903952 RepID=A0A1Q9GA22_9GAMM|nr:hypothetical protein [Photobacterium proteolyticum]OLQ71208.1 hypothetical protein BIT28_03315 [Photobacterium proteolyticum]
MTFNRVMQPRQQEQFQAIGEFLYIEACPDTVLIRTERGEYRLKPGAQIIDSKLTGRITVENLGEAGAVSIICGFGRYIPPTDGQKVDVTQMPAVVFAPGQQVDIASPVMLADGQVIGISQLPKVQLADGQQVTVSQLPAIQLAANQQLAVTHLPDVVLAAGQQVGVTELPKVKLETGQAVRVYATTPLLTKPVGGDSVASQVLTLAAGAAVLAKNTSRCHVLLKAPTTNTHAVTLGSDWELTPGEPLKLETTAELAFAGTDGDTIQIIEVSR